jgi:hypothetical protein
MNTNFVTKKQINNKLLQLTNIKNTKCVKQIKNKEDALECLKQHSFWLSDEANNNLLCWMFKFATNNDLLFVEKYLQDEIFVDKLSTVINIKTFGIQHLSLKHEDCVKYIIFNNICKDKDRLFFVDKVTEYGDISLLKLLIKRKYPITSYTLVAAIKSGDINKVQLLIKNIVFKVSDKTLQKIVKEVNASAILIYLHELYNFDIEKVCVTIVQNTLIEFISYCKGKNLITSDFISKLIRIGGIKWITILENYVDLQILFRITTISKHMEPYFKFIIQNYDVWSIPHIDNLILEVQEDNIIKTLVYNFPLENYHLKESILLIISQYIVDTHKQQLYNLHILGR